ncbi:MAG: bifunctional folylpolyglutamate synthase/dihydrofolate synthase [Deltaproteobacteria bacterium]|nr:bifunctional folylpolyglutamate synthase/dihydrofolate synthase [Deltaproteobacteria bacterium]
MGIQAPRPSDGFESAYAWLLTLEPRGIRLGLDRVRQALARLGSPHERLKVVTIAGTNGKGSTAAFLSSILHEAGYRVGLYTSPHLSRVTERVRIGGAEMDEKDFVGWAWRIQQVIESTDPIDLTFFEALTVMAIGYFDEREVDIAVLEVGLGGRLDATAVVPPLVSVITPIGYDHQAWLGDSLEAICTEKAGIIQQGATVVTNVRRELFRTVIGPRALDLRCPIRRAGVDYVHQWLHEGLRYRGWIHRVGPVKLGIQGLHQAGNAALACAAAESLCASSFSVKAVHMAEGLHRARHPGRMEIHPPRVDPAGRRWPRVLLDGAHNPMAAQVLASQVKTYLPERPRVLLFSARPDKDVAAMMEALAPEVDRVVVTAIPDTPLPDLEVLSNVAHHHGAWVDVEPDLDEALSHARQEAGDSGGVLVAGSLHLVGAVLPHLPGAGGILATVDP